MVDVTYPLIVVEFLSYFGLLVDCRNNRLLDGVASFSAPAQAASALIPSVKTISEGTPVDQFQREVRQNTLHHFRTIPGLPGTYLLRRLAPDQLAIAKTDFDAMLLDGTARR
jgi:hypothetical protein